MTTTATSADFFLLAHSHGVALLDGISDWRESGIVGVSDRDARFGDAFQGQQPSRLTMSLPASWKQR